MTQRVGPRRRTDRAEIRLHPATRRLIESNAIAKGNVPATARLAGIMAAKRTGELVPLRPPLPITHCEVTFELLAGRDRVVITASAKIAAQTGVEMEALPAVTVAALTIYDRCKAVDKAMVISEVRLLSKTKASRGRAVTGQLVEFGGPTLRLPLKAGLWPRGQP